MTTTTACGPFYDGKTMPFLWWTSSPDSAIKEMDVDPIDGSIYACGYVYGTTTFDRSFSITGNGNPRGFVAKFNHMGYTQWLTALGQASGAKSFVGCG